MCGILMSMLITSGLSTSVWVTASRPSRASPHTSSCGSDAMMPCSTLRMNAESSTISTRVFLLNVISCKISLLSRRCFLQRLSRRRADQLSYCCNKLVFLYGLGQERHCALFHCPVPMLGSSTRRDHHHRNVASLRILPQMRQQFVAVRPRHFQVGDNQVAARLRNDLQRFQSVCGQLHAIARLL